MMLLLLPFLPSYYYHSVSLYIIIVHFALPLLLLSWPTHSQHRAGLFECRDFVIVSVVVVSNVIVVIAVVVVFIVVVALSRRSRLLACLCMYVWVYFHNFVWFVIFQRCFFLLLLHFSYRCFFFGELCVVCSSSRSSNDYYSLLKTFTSTKNC